MTETVAGLPSDPNNMTATTPSAKGSPSVSQIDAEILQHEEAVRDLKSQRNALAPISKLPPEMLSRIFLFVSYPHGSYKSLLWINVSHVSQHWRAVALGFPALWSSPPFTTPAWAHEMLKRSKMAPLTIVADLTYMTPKMLAAFDNAMKQVDRSAELSLTGTKNMEKYLTGITKRAPFLTKLCISQVYIRYHEVEEKIVLPDNFLDGQAPRLRHLDLNRCQVHWDSALMQNLTYLKIVEPGDFRPTISQLVDVLEQVPWLETLDLEHALPIVSETTKTLPSPSHIISLLHLSQICLTSTVLESANLLNHIDFPSTATMRLILNGTKGTGADFSSLVPTISKSRTFVDISSDKTLKGAPFKVLSLTSVYPNDVRFSAYTISNSFANCVQFAPPALELQLSWRPDSFGTKEQVTQTICRALPLAQLRVLRVFDPECDFKHTTWIDLFGSLPKLQKIELAGATKIFTRALSEIRPPSVVDADQGYNLRKKGQTPDSVYFPRLRSLILTGADFADLVDMFLDMLMVRAECGTEVQELSLEDCAHLYEEDVGHLEEVVVELVWDNRVQDSEMYDSDEDDGFSDSLDDEYGHNVFPFFDMYDDVDWYPPF
ncbi:uncharacterized protein BT62DRAFT_994944 [Guyanagaster necrorhizus]|uniref:F-box domain-containing protein n=1 Tax=Guyanagaster necrorhizus TaxID=856835 RepID=A0A9P7VR39_9AGAR|nr:uncharacterized protein BT62DRAFT_994944 [Guyanagaster necrorhizus MCA 3950]KAG7444915.1 hypothetical protein BT62DRAFT_994944 [Guyanagaster necrorhizus MCA 3950]